MTEPTADDTTVEPAATMTPARRLRIALPIVAGIVLLDQLTKQWALETLDDGHVIEVLPGLQFDLVFNSGFSFSAGAGNGPIIGALVVALCGAMVWYLRRATAPRTVALVAVVLGGALGNLVDRLFRADDGFMSGEVVDFIDVTWYAVFNVADMAVVCGAIAVVAVEWWAGRAQPDVTDA